MLDRNEPEQAFAALGAAIDRLQASTGGGLELADLLLFCAEVQANSAARRSRADPLRPRVGRFHGLAPSCRSRRPPEPVYAEALTHLRALAELDPLNADAHRSTASLLADTAGRDEAQRHLDELASRFPYCYPLVKLRAESAYLIPTKRQSTTPGTCSNCVRTTPGPCVSWRSCTRIASATTRRSPPPRPPPRSQPTRPTSRFSPTYTAAPIASTRHQYLSRRDPPVSRSRAGHLRVDPGQPGPSGEEGGAAVRCAEATCRPAPGRRLTRLLRPGHRVLQTIG